MSAPPTRARAGRAAAAWMAGALWLGASLIGASAQAQDATQPRPSGAQDATQPRSSGALILRSEDGASSLRLLGLLQLQYAHAWSQGSAETDTLFVHRARVGLMGHLVSEDLQYMLVAELAPERAGLLFATLDYTLVREWLTLRVGRFKRPFSRSFLALASQLTTIDRPLVVGPSVFGDAVDVGVMIHNGSRSGLEYSLGVFSGDAAQVLPDRVDPLLAFRLAYNLGEVNGYRESDLGGGAPRLSVAVAGLVDFDTDGEHRSFANALVDFLFKAHGLALLVAGYVGTQQSGPGWADRHLRAAGFYSQVSYAIGELVEPVLRYGLLAQLGDAASTTHEAIGGVNLYLLGRLLSLQTSARARWTESRETTTPTIELQSQLNVALP